MVSCTGIAHILQHRHTVVVCQYKARWMTGVTWPERVLSRSINPQIADYLNTLRPRQDGRHFPDDIFKIFLNENIWMSIKISPKFVPKGPFNDIPALVQIMAWRLTGAKPISEPMLVSLLTHICVTRPQWVNDELPWLPFPYHWPYCVQRSFTFRFQGK